MKKETTSTTNYENAVIAKRKKPFYKKWWVWLIGVIILIAAIDGSNDEPATTTPAVADKKVEEVKPEPKEEPKPEVVPEVKEETKPEPKEEPKPEPVAKTKPEPKPAAKPVDTGETKEVKLNNLLLPIIENSGGIVKTVMHNPYHDEDGSFMHVVVSDTWYSSPEHEKLRFADAVGQLVRKAVYDSGLQTSDKTVIVDIIDSYGVEVASQGIFTGEYKIKK